MNKFEFCINQVQGEISSNLNQFYTWEVSAILLLI